MKNITFTLILSLLMSMVGLNAFAEFDWTKVKVGTLYYYLGYDNGLAQVTFPESRQYTSKTIKIPSTITHSSLMFDSNKYR